MPLSLQSLNFAIICDGDELETYDAKQDGPNSIQAYVASEAGKQFNITLGNNLFDFDLSIALYIDGECIERTCLRARRQGQILGIRKTASTVLPFKFQEIQLADPDVENAPVASEMGTIEIRAFRCNAWRTVQYLQSTTNGLHQGRVSERSKKAGWHHVSTADEVLLPASAKPSTVYADYFDPEHAPFVSVKIFYRPRELLMAKGVITGYGVGARIGGGPETNEKKRAREDHSSGPSTKRRTGSTVKKEEMSANARAQRIQALQAELNSLTAEQYGSSVKCELKPPSPLVIDLTLDD